MVKRMFKAVLFDLDGTLVNSSEGILNATKETLFRLGMEPPSDDEIRSCIGPPVGETLQLIMKWSESQKKEFYEIFRPIYRDKYVFQCEIYPGILQLLEELKKRNLLVGIATNKRNESTDSLLRHLGIERIFDVVIAQDRKMIRNKADMILDALKLLQTDIDDTVMIGDSVGDYKAAQGVGVSFIGVRYGFGFKETIDEDIELVDSTEELLRLLLH